MGYRLPPKVTKMTFDVYPDLEVKVISWIPMADLLRVQKALVTLDEEDMQEVGRFFLAEVLADWNLEDADGNPISPTEECMSEVPSQLVLTLLRAWIDHVGTLPIPLGLPSPNGDPSAEESEAMESSLVSQSS